MGAFIRIHCRRSENAPQEIATSGRGAKQLLGGGGGEEKVLPQNQGYLNEDYVSRGFPGAAEYADF
jgi:hypothetical protein